MAKKQNYWYVMVMTDGGPVFVTSVSYADKTAHWNKNETPLELGMYQAKDLTLGLNLNFHQAYAVCQPFELESQPYRYDRYHIEWKENEEGEEEDV